MMGFAMGSTCFSQAPLHFSRFPFSSVSSCSCSSQSASLHTRNADAKERSGAPAALKSENYLNDDGFCKRRAILFLGISVFPLLQLKAQAIDSSPPGSLVLLIFFFFLLVMWLFGKFHEMSCNLVGVNFQRYVKMIVQLLK